MNPLNQLPANADWLCDANAITADAAKRLGCMVLLVAVQERGKVCACIEGVPDTGDLHDLAQSGVPSMLATLAQVVAIHDGIELMRLKQ